jgi:hypothetical protein
VKPVELKNRKNMLDQTVLDRINRKLNRVLAEKSWKDDLNLLPVNNNAARAFEGLLDYVDQLQKQVRGLEDTIRNLR